MARSLWRLLASFIAWNHCFMDEWTIKTPNPIQYVGFSLKWPVNICVAFGWWFLIGPCRLQRLRTTTRNRQKMQGIQGPKKSLERRIQGPRVTQQVHVSPTLFLGRAGDKAGWAETPYPPPQGIPLPQLNYPSKTSLGGNLASAYKSGSEVIVLTQDERGEYF
jgi:hypothetical protein